ncbi:MAG: DsbA family protein [Candidatus Anstonellales archaeon]
MAEDEIRVSKQTLILVGIIAIFLIAFVYLALNANAVNAGTSNTGKANTGNAGQGNVDEVEQLLINSQRGGKINVDISQISANGAVMEGTNKDILIVEFSDFQCPFCGRFFSSVLPELKANYIDKGKATFVYMHFPLSSIHPMAQKAAEAFECAKEQGKGKEMHDKIFLNQQLLSVASLKQWAQDIGLDADKFNTCLDSGRTADKVNADLNEGLKLGVQRTPTIFVGKRGKGYSYVVVGASSGDMVIYSKIIDSLQ